MPYQGHVLSTTPSLPTRITGGTDHNQIEIIFDDNDPGVSPSIQEGDVLATIYAYDFDRNEDVAIELIVNSNGSSVDAESLNGSFTFEGLHAQGSYGVLETRGDFLVKGIDFEW